MQSGVVVLYLKRYVTVFPILDEKLISDLKRFIAKICAAASSLGIENLTFYEKSPNCVAMLLVMQV